jgi:hypothetical protein
MFKIKDIVEKQAVSLHESTVLCGVQRNFASDGAEWIRVVEGEINGDFVKTLSSVIRGSYNNM